MVTQRELWKQLRAPVREAGPKALEALVHQHPVTAFRDETLRVVVNRMAVTGHTRLPVVDPNDPHKLVGIISLRDLLSARVRNIEEERHRQRVLQLKYLFRPEPMQPGTDAPEAVPTNPG